MSKVQHLIAKRSSAQLAMLAACAAVFLTVLDLTVVVTALPQMRTDLQIPDTQLDKAAWIVSGYLLGSVIIIPLILRVFSTIFLAAGIFCVIAAILALGLQGKKTSSETVRITKRETK